MKLHLTIEVEVDSTDYQYYLCADLSEVESAIQYTKDWIQDDGLGGIEAWELIDVEEASDEDS